MSQVLGLAQETITGLQQPAATNEPAIIVEPVVTTTEVTIVSKETAVAPKSADAENHEQDISSDYDYARKTLYHLIELGNDALEHLMPLAKESESPRGFEVTHMLLKTTSEMAKDLLELHQRMDALYLVKNKEEKATTTNIQNNTVVMTTADMVRMAREAIDISIEPTDD